MCLQDLLVGTCVVRENQTRSQKPMETPWFVVRKQLQGGTSVAMGKELFTGGTGTEAADSTVLR